VFPVRYELDFHKETYLPGHNAVWSVGSQLSHLTFDLRILPRIAGIQLLKCYNYLQELLLSRYEL
jgi:hypothetical protein